MNVHQNTIDDNKKIDILVTKYGLLRGDIAAQINYFKNHIRNFQLVFIPIITSIGYFSVEPKYAPNHSNRLFWLLLGYAVITVCCYAVYDILEAGYWIRLLEARLASLETKINQMADDRLLIWQSEACELFNKSTPFHGVTAPLFFLKIYLILIVIFFIFGIPVWLSSLLWGVGSSMDVVFRGLIVGLLAYSCMSMALILRMIRSIDRGVNAGAKEALSRILSVRNHNGNSG
jgi:hypothetical protein